MIGMVVIGFFGATSAVEVIRTPLRLTLPVVWHWENLCPRHPQKQQKISFSIHSKNRQGSVELRALRFHSLREDSISGIRSHHCHGMGLETREWKDDLLVK